MVGNSLPILMVPPRASRSEATYPEHLETLLRNHGLDVEVRNHSRLFGMIHEGYRRFQLDVVPWAPDVLVLHFGIIEMQPNVVPTLLSRHFTRQHTGGKGIVGVYRRRVMPRAWPKVRTFQRRASGLAGQRTWRMTPAHFEAELRRFIAVAREQQMLVLVCDMNRPGPRLQHFIPGITKRFERFERILEWVVQDIDDEDVRLQHVSRGLCEEDDDVAFPDGLHFTARGHLEVAKLLADEISPWLRARSSQVSR